MIAFVGYVSWRQARSKGSLYIQTLCGQIQDHKHDWTFVQMLCRVSNVLAHEFESNHRDYPNRKQMPVFTCQLTKDLYFAKSK